MFITSQALKSFYFSVNSPQSPLFSRILSFVKIYMARNTQRKALAKLDDRMLKDIAVTKEQAILQANKPFWE